MAKTLPIPEAVCNVADGPVMDPKNNRLKLETGAGEGHDKCAALIRNTGDGDIATMGPGNGSGKAQAQTDTGL